MNRFAIPTNISTAYTISRSFLRSRAPIALALGVSLLFGSLPVPVLAADSAKKEYQRAQAFEAHEDYDGAFEAYKRAYAKEPTNLRYRASFSRLRPVASSDHVTQGRKLLQQGDESSALGQFLRAAEIDPANEAASQEIARLRAKQANVPIRTETSLTPEAQDSIEDAGSPAQLKPVSSEPLTLRMTEDSKVVYQAIGKAAGINVLFDPDYNGKRVQVDLTNISLLDALRIVGTLSNTFWRPITENTIFVATNNRSKHTELDEQAVQTFYLSNAWQTNDLNDVQTALRNVMANAKVYGVPSQNALVVRATPDELTLAQKIINDLDKARPEVVVDVAIMEVDKDRLRNIGLSWPGSISFALQPPTSSTSTTTTTTTDSTTSTALSLNNLANLNANNFAVTVGSATANLLLTDSDSKILQNPRIRATDGQKANLKIGSRIPIATGSYQTGATTAITSSLVNTQFQYIDVGVEIEMTPTVHFDHDITLKLKITDSSESGTETISGVTEPILANKSSEQTIRLKEGEATILAGLLNKQDLVSLSGIPGLAELPLFKYIFGSRSHEVIDDEIVFVIVPHVVRGQDLSPINLRRIDTGPGTAIELRHIGNNAPAATAAPGQAGASVSRPVNPSPTVGPLRGQTAEAAVASAISQIRQQNASDIPSTVVNPPVPTAPPGPPIPITSSFILGAPSTPPTVGSSFSIPVTLNGAKDVTSVPLQIQYDATKLTLVGVTKGDLLSKDGQDPALIHRDEGPGLITIATSRPPGTPGITGSGSVVVLNFQAKQLGASDVVITRHAAIDSAQHPLPVSAQNAHIVVQ
jgi:general secretion pathway protein D